MNGRRFVVALVLLVGCTPHVPMSGVVVKKQYRPAWTQIVFFYDGRGAMYPTPIFHPERWELVIQSDGTDGEEGQFLVVVSERRYESLGVGDVWKRDDTVTEKPAHETRQTR